MGNDCGKNFPNPDTTNRCNQLGETHVIPHFCSLAGPGGDGYRRQWCAALGAPGEWEAAGESGICAYNDCHPYQEVETGCCNGCCGIVGAGAVCRRRAFTGDPIECCLLDFDCRGGLNNCFTDPLQQNTCDPTLRSANSLSCQSQLFVWMAGNDLPPGSIAWTGRWMDGNGNPLPDGALYVIQRNLFGIGGQQCSLGPPIDTQACQAINTDLFPISADGLRWCQSVMRQVFQNYARAGFAIGALPGTPSYHPFQDFLYRYVACPYPFLVQDALKTVCNVYTTDRIIYQPNIANWCGCHLPDAEYATYVDQYQLNVDCTPLCNRSSVIPRTVGNGAPLRCTQTACIIDDVTIQLINTTVGGNITLGQMCQSCTGPDTSCVCLISDSSLDAAQSAIGGNINLTEVCGGGARCDRTRTNPQTGKTQTLDVSCSEPPDFNPFPAYDAATAQAEAGARTTRFWKAVIFILVLTLILAFAFWYLRPC